MSADKEKKNIFRFIYQNIFLLNDTPQRIALGFGIGVFLGILPGTGVLAAIFLALVFRLNRASAILGSMLTNTWLSIVAFALALKVGAGTMHIDYISAHAGYAKLFKDFHWNTFLGLTAFKVILPVMLGYIIISALAGFLAYLLMLGILVAKKNPRSATASHNQRS